MIQIDRRPQIIIPEKLEGWPCAITPIFTLSAAFSKYESEILNDLQPLTMKTA